MPEPPSGEELIAERMHFFYSAATMEKLSAEELPDSWMLEFDFGSGKQRRFSLALLPVWDALVAITRLHEAGIQPAKYVSISKLPALTVYALRFDKAGNIEWMNSPEFLAMLETEMVDALALEKDKTALGAAILPCELEIF